MCELTILEVSHENESRFHPMKYWISPNLSGNESEISSLINRIQPGLQRTKNFGSQKTIHIGSINDVLSYCSSNLYYISYQVLSDLALKYRYHHFQVSHLFKQCISLCLHELCIAASGSFEKEEIINIENKVSLLGANFVSMRNASEIDVFVTNYPVIPSKMFIFSDSFEIVNSQWVDDSFKNLARMDYDDYSVGCFNSLRICSSDLDPAYHKQIKELVLKGKGIWSESLDKFINFLIASHLSSTQKVKIALEMSIPIIDPKWIYMQSKQPCSIERFVLNFWCLQSYTKSSLFSKLSFAIHLDCENRNCVIEAIKAHSGEFTGSPDYYIVPHFFQSTSDQTFVTVSWVWECITQKKLIDPNSSLEYRPFSYQKVSSKLKNYVVVLYNFQDDMKRYEITECLRALGVCVHYKISKMSSIVVSEKEDQAMIKNAKKYSLQIVSSQWVYKLIKTGKLPSAKSYLYTNEKDMAVQSIRQGILRRTQSIIQKSQPAIDKSNDRIPALGDHLCKLLSDEFQLTQFSDNENDIQTSPTIKITYETPITKSHEKKLDHEDPLLKFMSDF